MPAKKSDIQLGVVVTPAQLRAARGLLNWSVAELAEQAGLALGTVRKAENPRDFLSVYRPNAELLRSTLEGAGVAFIDADDMGAGARLIDPKVEPTGSRRSQAVS
jgi:transcriptional regulator with XRE-family HTH domain